MLKININTKAVVAFSNKLEKMSKTALPKAVRYTLNSAAFDVKTNTMPKAAEAAFEKRTSNFFKANSKVLKAEGTDLRGMKATVGFTSLNLKGKTNFAVKDLEQQEHGGKIAGKSLIPTPLARIGNSRSKLVRKALRIGKDGNLDGRIINSNHVRGRTKKQRFSFAVAKAGRGGFVLGDKEFKNGNRMIWRVNSTKRKADGKFDLTAIYKVIKGRKVPVRPTHFMEKSSIESAKKMEAFYIAEAKKRIARL